MTNTKAVHHAAPRSLVSREQNEAEYLLRTTTSWVTNMVCNAIPHGIRIVNQLYVISYIVAEKIDVPWIPEVGNLRYARVRAEANAPSGSVYTPIFDQPQGHSDSTPE
jgi:hypothetical protein